VAAVGCPYLILRTSWIFGARGQNFARIMLRLAHEREELRVVDDQIGAPTWCRFLAEATAQIVAQGGDDVAGYLRERQGLYHCTAAGSTSWHGFARLVLELDPRREEQRLQRLEAIPTAEYPTPAARPANSVLACGKLMEGFGIALPMWDVGVRMAFAVG
jgi:dTDP-4-dehydrorhamnose reductase